MTRSHIYINELRTLLGTDLTGPRQSIVFHPRLDTIVMDIPTMLDLHLHWQDAFQQNRILAIPAILSLGVVQTLALPITVTYTLERFNMLVLGYFIRPNQIPAVPPGQGTGSPVPDPEDAMQLPDNLRPHFPNARVTFEGPAVSIIATYGFWLQVQTEMMARVPSGQQPAGIVGGLIDSVNEHMRILSIIEAIEDVIEDFNSPWNPASV